MVRNDSYICNVVFQCILGGVRSPMKPYDKQKYFCRLILETLSPIVYFNFISCYSTQIYAL